MIVVTIDSDRDDETAVCLEHREDGRIQTSPMTAPRRAFGSRKAVRAQVAKSAGRSGACRSSAGPGAARTPVHRTGRSAILGVGTLAG